MYAPSECAHKYKNMKKFFQLSLRGRDFLCPMVAMLVAAVALCVGLVLAMGILEPTEGGATLVDGRFGLYLLVSGVLYFAYGFVQMWALLPVMTKTIGSLSYDGAPFETDYNRGDYLRMVAGGVALSVVTCGIYTPWFVARLMRFFAEGVSHKFNHVSFRGKGMRLLAVTVLVLIVPFMLLGLLAASVNTVAEVDMMSFAPLVGLVSVVGSFFFMGLYVVLIYRWCIDLTYGDKVVTTRLPLWGASLYVVGQFVLIMLTLGLYTPAAQLRIMRYITRHTLVEDGEGKERKFGIGLRMWSDWGFLWVQTLLLVVTFGLYLPWYYAKVTSRFTERLYIIEN